MRRKRSYTIRALVSGPENDVEAIVDGPGIGRSGVRYWAPTAVDAVALVENLNLAEFFRRELNSRRAVKRSRSSKPDF